MEAEQIMFIDIILPLPLRGCFTYALPQEEWAEEVKVGCRVVVPFGRKKLYTGIVQRIHDCAPTSYEVKEATALLDRQPILTDTQFKFWEWIADYYLCTLGDVFKAAMPAGMKLEDEKLVGTHPGASYDKANRKGSSRIQLRTHHGASLQPVSLSTPQHLAYNSILQTFSEKNVCLLHGVTASGKTEIYIHLIEETIRKGKQVLYLLPEIALTTQITDRLRAVFGDRLGIYHSKFTDAQRVAVWQKQLSDEPYDIILGVRSSVFLPFHELGLVIIDEEHENTYKQQDPAPRYHARNAAILLASLYGAKTLLGTATPSIESWHNAVTGKYGLVELKERYKEIQLPEIIPVDIKELHRKKRMNGPFSPLLLQYVREALAQGEQVILFQNRRGFAPMIECHTCGWVPKCQNCDVSLTYHKGLNQLTCHYCGYTLSLPYVCPACEGKDLRYRGFGTEKIEDDIQALLPEARLARMDLDTTRTRKAYERIISDFQQHKTDILIGTQMVSKGLDFDHVSVVGILNADTMLNYPDFRAYERAFQLMAQVAGRAGRKGKRGRVVLQTKSIDHPIIAQVIRNDFQGMVDAQLAERQLFRFPPYYRLVYVYLKHKNETLLELMSQTMADKLRAVFGNRVLGPDKPPVARLNTLFIRKLMIKIEASASLSRARTLLRSVQQEMQAQDRFKSLIIYYDVDPM